MSEGKMEQNQMSEEIILNEMIDRSRMIGDLISPDELLYQYRDANSPGFIPGIEYLSRIYNMRKVRGDGNCFYRAFLFAYLEELLIRYTAEGPEVKQSAIDERQRFLNKIENSKAELVEIGYSEMAIETFHDVIVELIQNLFNKSTSELFELFQEGGECDYYTWYMRLLTSAAMKKQADRFLPFVEDMYTPDMITYTNREVEPMGRECEQVQIIALTEYLNISVRIEYLDGKLFDVSKGLSVVVCPEIPIQKVNEMYQITLLYRPGHYDILYKKS